MAVGPLRRTPGHEHERVSELLFGERFEIEERRTLEDGAVWLRVRTECDGYEGWLRAWYAEEVGREPEAASPEERTEAWVESRCLEIRERPSARAAVKLALPRAARVVLGPIEGRWVRVELPAGECGWAPLGALARGQPPGGPASGRRLVRTAARYQGAPYLWGGRSPWGVDCSGYVQAVYAWHGLAIPRDAAEQLRAAPNWGRRRRLRGRSGGRTDGSEARAGDLLFFGAREEAADHVAISLGDKDFLHAQGWVRRGSLEPASPLAEGRLRERYLGAWGPRPAGGARRGASPESA